MARLKKIGIGACVILLLSLLFLIHTVAERSSYARSQVEIMAWEIGELDRALPWACEGRQGMVNLVYITWINLYSHQLSINDRKLPWEQEISCIEPFDESRMKEVYAEDLRKGSFDRAIDILESDGDDPYQIVKSALEELGRVM